MTDDPTTRSTGGNPPASSPASPTRVEPIHRKVGSTSDADKEAGEGHKGPRTDDSSEGGPEGGCGPTESASEPKPDRIPEGRLGAE